MSKKIITLILILLTGIVLAQPVFGVRISNPLGTTTFDQMLDRVLSWIWPLSIVIAVLMTMIGAYFLVFSGGDPQRASTGRDVVTYALIGLAIVTLAKGIVGIVELIIGPGTDPLQILPRTITWLFGFLIITAVLMVLISGYLFVTSAGNPERVRKARNCFIYALIGLAVGVLSRGIVGVVLTIVLSD